MLISASTLTTYGIMGDVFSETPVMVTIRISLRLRAFLSRPSTGSKVDGLATAKIITFSGMAGGYSAITITSAFGGVPLRSVISTILTRSGALRRDTHPISVITAVASIPIARHVIVVYSVRGVAVPVHR